MIINSTERDNASNTAVECVKGPAEKHATVYQIARAMVSTGMRFNEFLLFSLYTVEFCRIFM